MGIYRTCEVDICPMDMAMHLRQIWPIYQTTTRRELRCELACMQGVEVLLGQPTWPEKNRRNSHGTQHWPVVSNPPLYARLLE